MLLEGGADPNSKASLRKVLKYTDEESVHEFRDVTPLAYGDQFHGRGWVNGAAMEVIREFGGRSYRRSLGGKNRNRGRWTEAKTKQIPQP